MSRFRLISRSARDLSGIRDWIARDNPPRAASYVAELTLRLQIIAEQPLIGRSRPEIGRDVRSVPHGSYLIFYRPAPHGIDVIRLVHGSRDLRRGLQ